VGLQGAYAQSDDKSQQDAHTQNPPATDAQTSNAQQQEQQPLGVPGTSPPIEETETEPTDVPPENKTVLDVYGFAQLDSGYEFLQSDPNWFDVMRPTKLPSFKNQFAPNGKVYFSVRQSRFGVKSSTPTPYGDLKTIFEFELFGTGVNAGQTTFRLRHAWGELKHFGAGQTWSPFMDPDVFPNSLEYWGPNGMVFFRTVHAAWMPINEKRMKLTFAAEQPGASADLSSFADRVELSGIRSRFNVPDFSGQVRVMRDWGHVQLAAIVRKIAWVDTNPAPVFKLGDTVWGWGVNLSSNVNFSKKTVGRFQGVYGKGIENYMNDAPVDIGIKTNFGNPVRPILGRPLPVVGGVGFLDHNWSERFSSSLGYSIVNIWNTNGELGSAYHQGHYALTNLLFYPVPKVMVGGEFQWGRRINFRDGFNVNDYRIQISFRFKWDKTFKL
jgi:hypothetical protein